MKSIEKLNQSTQTAGLGLELKVEQQVKASITIAGKIFKGKGENRQEAVEKAARKALQYLDTLSIRDFLKYHGTASIHPPAPQLLRGFDFKSQ